MPRILFAPLFALAVLLTSCGSSGSTPAATVNGHDIATSDFNAELHYDRVSQAKQIGYDVCSVKGLDVTCRYLKRQALNGVIDRELIREYAARHHITVTAADDARNWAVVYHGKFSNDPRQLNAFVQSFGITVNQLRSRLRDSLLRDKVLYDVTKHMPLTAPAIRLAVIQVRNKEQLNQVEQKLHAGMAFNLIARQLSKDSKSGCARNCGDLGWIPRRLIPPTASQVANASRGALVGPLQLQTGGYTLYLIEASQPNYQLTPQQQISVRGQVFGTWIAHQEQLARIKRNVSV